MMTDKYTEKLLEQYFRGELSLEEKLKFFESLRSNPSLLDTVTFVLHNTDSHKVKEFLAEKDLLSQIDVISEQDEALIELFINGLMSESEEDDFKKKLVPDQNLKDNALAIAFLNKAIQKILNQGQNALNDSKKISIENLSDFFSEIRAEEDDEIIDRYLNETLTDSEVSSFENRLRSDLDFKERVKSVAVLSKGIKRQEEIAIHAINDAKSIEAQDVINTINELERKPKNRLFITFASPFIRNIAACVTVIFVLGLGYDYYNSTQVQLLADNDINMVVDHFSSDQTFKDDGTAEDVYLNLKAIFSEVKNHEKIESNIKNLKKMYDIAIDDKVDIEDDYVDQISLALATAYVYNGQKSDAKEILNHIINDNEANVGIKKAAEQLLDRINKTFIF